MGAENAWMCECKQERLLNRFLEQTAWLHGAIQIMVRISSIMTWHIWSSALAPPHPPWPPCYAAALPRPLASAPPNLAYLEQS